MDIPNSSLPHHPTSTISLFALGGRCVSTFFGQVKGHELTCASKHQSASPGGFADPKNGLILGKERGCWGWGVESNLLTL